MHLWRTLYTKQIKRLRAQSFRFGRELLKKGRERGRERGNFDFGISIGQIVQCRCVVYFYSLKYTRCMAGILNLTGKRERHGQKERSGERKGNRDNR